jgi:hypothetical protein
MYFYSTIYSLFQFHPICRPSNPQELFNLRHASAQNVVERIFGILKCRFHILLLAPEYDMGIQSMVSPALCALHYFICRNDPSDVEDYTDMVELSHIRVDDPGIRDLALHALTAAECECADNKWDQIVQAMWDDYQCVVHEQGEALEDPPEV